MIMEIFPGMSLKYLETTQASTFHGVLLLYPPHPLDVFGFLIHLVCAAPMAVDFSATNLILLADLLLARGKLLPFGYC